MNRITPRRRRVCPAALGSHALLTGALAGLLCSGVVRADEYEGFYDQPVREILDEPMGRPIDGPHETPLAGEAYEGEVLGAEVEVPPRERSEVAAITLGGTLYNSKIADTRAAPLLSYYYFSDLATSRIRAQLSGLVNDVELAADAYDLEELGDFEGVLRFQNDQTRLFAQPEVVGGQEVEGSELSWGDLSMWLGAGWAVPLAPFRIENGLRVQLFYRMGYEHYEDTSDTGLDFDVPENTWIHGPWLRIRLDGLQRNLLEIPHVGYAIGADVEFTQREDWVESGTSGNSFDPVRDAGDESYLKISGYGVTAAGVPWLSERHRMVAQVDAGFAPDAELDRFSAFRIGGGPLPKESSDLNRNTYPGALFGQFLSDGYVVATLGYRYELFFFLYLHARATLFHGRIATDAGRLGTRYSTRQSESYTAAITTGFPWDSSLYLEYAYETGLARGSHDGHQFLLLWSKPL